MQSGFLVVSRVGRLLAANATKRCWRIVFLHRRPVRANFIVFANRVFLPIGDQQDTSESMDALRSIGKHDLLLDCTSDLYRCRHCAAQLTNGLMIWLSAEAVRF